MNEKYNKKVLLEFNEKIDRLMKKEGIVLSLFQKNVEEFSKIVRFLRKNRENHCKELEEWSFNRLKTFEKIREVLKLIRVNEKKNDKLSLMLKKLEERENLIKKEYDTLLSGMNGQSIEISAQVGLNDVYRAGKKVEMPSIFSKKDELIARRKEFLEGLKTSFDKLESELLKIEQKKNKIKDENSELLDNVCAANRHHGELQKVYTGQIKEIKRLKSVINAACKEEAAILSDYSRLLAGIKTAIDIPKEARIRMLPVLSRIDEEKESDDKDWVLEVEDLSESKDNIIKFPKAG